MAELTIDQIEFEIICHPEHTLIEGHFDSGDKDLDFVIETDISDQLQNGNLWAWCCVEMKASFESFEESTYLGCCSYKSENDFIKGGGYYESMKDELFEIITKRWNEALQAYPKETLLKELRRRGYFVDTIWCDDDIIGRAEQLEVELSEKQVQEVIDYLIRTHDAEIGINWEVIDNAIHEILKG